MELVAAAKMRRAQSQALATRTYSNLVWDLVQNLADQTHPEMHRLLRQPEATKRIGVVLLTSNRGLIGGFNNNLINTALNLDADKSADYKKLADESARYRSDEQRSAPIYGLEPKFEYITLGKKGRDGVRKRGKTIAAEFEKKDTVGSVLDIAGLARLVSEDFVAGKYDRVVIVYSQFITTLSQKPVVKEVLPLSTPSQSPPIRVRTGGEGEPGFSPPPKGKGERQEGVEYLFEPTPDQVLETLLPCLIEMQLYQALLETNASEHSARMVAMKNASDAAGDLVNELSLEYNQLRQASITKEISEIVAGKLALTD